MKPTYGLHAVKQHWTLRSHRRRNQNTRIRRRTSNRNIKLGRLRPLNPSPRPNRAATEQTNQRHKPQKSKTATKTKPLTIQRPSEFQTACFIISTLIKHLPITKKISYPFPMQPRYRLIIIPAQIITIPLRQFTPLIKSEFLSCQIMR